MISKVLSFRINFEKSWLECLKKIEFKEINAHQFRLGNRLRPTLFFMGASYGNIENDNKKLAELSCSLELIHKASVMFDDFVDGDELRNGKEAFHMQYQNINKMILLGSTMLGQAGINWTEDLTRFRCDLVSISEGSSRLYEIIKRLCTGCYRELSLPGYGKQCIEEINSITYDETVFLIQTSLVLGYIAGHTVIDEKDKEYMEILGCNFGYIFQWLNDIEVFSKKENYLQHKGSRAVHFDYGRKNIAVLRLYNVSTKEEKSEIENYKLSYDQIIQRYQYYEIEKYVLEKVNEKCDGIREILKVLQKKDKHWVAAFQCLFEEALHKKDWTDKVNNIRL